MYRILYLCFEGEENVNVRILDEVCANILENAKEIFQTKVENAKKANRGKSPGQVKIYYLNIFFITKSEKNLDIFLSHINVFSLYGDKKKILVENFLSFLFYHEIFYCCFVIYHILESMLLYAFGEVRK